MEAAMSIEEKVRQALARQERQHSSDLQHLRDFYEEKKREGIAVTQEYTLPPMDTVGRSLYVDIRDKEKNTKP